jgi:hypothetical protein
MLWLIYPLTETPPTIHFYIRLFVSTASTDVEVMKWSLFFLPCSSGLYMTNGLFWRVQIHSTRVLMLNVLTGSYKQTFICHPFWLKGPILGSRHCVSFCRLQAGFTSTVLHRKLVILLGQHCTVSVSSNVMSGPGKRPRLLRPSEISELIFDTDSDEARVSSNISSVERSSECVPGVS